MSKKTRDVVVGETTYKITQVGAETGESILFKIGQAIAGSLAEDANALSIVRSVRLLSVEDFRETVRALASSTQVGIKDVDGDGRVNFVKLSSVYDDHFAGKYSELLEWLKAALEVNFGDFLGAFKRAVATSASAPKA